MNDLETIRATVERAGEWAVGPIEQNAAIGPCFSVYAGSSTPDYDDNGDAVEVYQDNWADIDAEGHAWMGSDPPEDLMDLLALLLAVKEASGA